MRTRLLGIALLLGGVPAWSQAPRLPSAAVPKFHQHAPRKSLGPAADQTGKPIIYESSKLERLTRWWEKHFSRRVDPGSCPRSIARSLRTRRSPFGLESMDGITLPSSRRAPIRIANSGSPSYYAWYEFAPKAGVTITSVPISPGDHMAAQVDYAGDSEFIVTITDQTTGAAYATSAAVPEAQRASAEWIAELNGYNLSDYGTVYFGDDFTHASGTNQATNATTSGPIGAFRENVRASVIVAGKDNNADVAVPGFLSIDGTSFTVTWWAK
jgi:hypothetical protein